MSHLRLLRLFLLSLLAISSSGCGPSGIWRNFWVVEPPAAIPDKRVDFVLDEEVLNATLTVEKKFDESIDRIVYRVGPSDVTPYNLPADTVLDSTGAPVLLDGHEISLDLIGCVSPGFPDRDRASHFVKVWDGMGRRLQADEYENPWFSVSLHPMRYYGYFVKADKELDFSLDSARFVLEDAPYDFNFISYGQRLNSDGDSISQFWTVPARPYGDPLILEIGFWYGEPERYELPLEASASVNVPNNRVTVVDVLDGYCTSSYFTPAPVVSFNVAPEGKNPGPPGPPSEAEKPWTSVLLHAAIAENAEGNLIMAETRNGELLGKVFYERLHQVALNQYKAARDDIAKLVVLHSPKYGIVRFHLPSLPDVPPENANVTNLLDLTYDAVHLENEDQIKWFLGHALGRAYDNSVSPAKKGPMTLRNVTLREILDECYGENWPLKKVKG